MTALLSLGHGYCASHFVALHGELFTRRTGTHRGEPGERDGTRLLTFAGTASPEQLDAATRADIVLASAAPGETGDPFLPEIGATLAASSRKGALIYLSTIGVYGDTGGDWIDESTQPAAASARARRRVAAEAAWQAVGAKAGRPVFILRLGGIYGPGRNALVDVAAGTARCIEREGQVFNRIHVDDIADAIRAACLSAKGGIVNVVDDEPSPSCAPVRFAAGLLGQPAPEPEPFALAAQSMSAMALSFWAENRRVRNDALHRLTGGPLRYPSYRDGLAALHAAAGGAAGGTG
ncbi:NAD-dependent epimerase/dehydratase family protein [Ancylobacter sp. A5.8]|uniref:NAD-dependent epimerase/dehydratase family protein n=1 Tax=Ancylobacter gelatini TaxID=2919920 RepID=UPI001F4DD03E|nr:NAD-dependent epimerase/dehydratase family protein [Ancylobacter gelatini]MCJ8143493.1 NAD-dependent epimerase/dehydratase family protein [Ancylobacter gelatini]